MSDAEKKVALITGITGQVTKNLMNNCDNNY